MDYNLRYLLAVVFILVFSIGCDTLKGERLHFQTLFLGTYAGDIYEDTLKNREPNFFVVTDRSQIEDISPYPLEPETVVALELLDYDVYFGLVVYRGQGPLANFEINSVYQRDNDISIKVNPGKRKIPEPLMFIPPYQVVAVEKKKEWRKEEVVFNLLFEQDEIPVLTKTYFIP